MKEGKLCHVFVPTILKLIQAARTKDVFISRNRWIARCGNQHESHVCGWKESEVTNTYHG